jgi:hypothetical protein
LIQCLELDRYVSGLLYIHAKARLIPSFHHLMHLLTVEQLMIVDDRRVIVREFTVLRTMCSLILIDGFCKLERPKYEGEFLLDILIENETVFCREMEIPKLPWLLKMRM